MNLISRNYFNIRMNNFAKSNTLKKLTNRQNELEKQLKDISDKKLNKDEKKQKIKELTEAIDDTNTQKGEEYLKETSNGGDKIKKQLKKCLSDEDNNLKNDKSPDTELSYSVISNSNENRNLRKLSYFREKAVREDGPDSERVKRIDKMISEKLKKVKSNSQIADEALKEIASNKRDEYLRTIQEAAKNKEISISALKNIRKNKNDINAKVSEEVESTNSGKVINSNKSEIKEKINKYKNNQKIIANNTINKTA